MLLPVDQSHFFIGSQFEYSLFHFIYLFGHAWGYWLDLLPQPVGGPGIDSTALGSLGSLFSCSGWFFVVLPKIGNQVYVFSLIRTLPA
jgi:hypothetical protein